MAGTESTVVSEEREDGGREEESTEKRFDRKGELSGENKGEKEERCGGRGEKAVGRTEGTGKE